ncbi:MAG: TolC family protein [Phycisphaerales bacterium JB043]
MTTRRSTRFLTFLALASFLLPACAPSWSRESRRPLISHLSQDVIDSYEASEPAPTSPPELETSSLEFDEARLEELRGMAGPDSYENDAPPEVGSLLGGWDSGPVSVSLDEAIATSVEHNLSVLSATLEPAIREEQRIAADAAFDLVFFADGSIANNDNPSAVPVVGGTPTGVGVNKSDSFTSSTGVRAQTRTGAQVEISGSLDVFNNASPGFTLTPDPSRTANLDVLISQNLLRGAGADSNEAQLRLASNDSARGQEQLRSSLMGTIESVERAYWELVESVQSVRIQERLLERGEQTRDALQGRRGFDVTDAELADAVAQVETRKADLIRARNTLQQRSDALRVLMNDPRYPISTEMLLNPTDTPSGEAITFSLVDSLNTALQKHPDVRLANLDIDDADIRQLAAEDARLPLLALDASVNLSGLDDDAGQAFSEAGEGDFLDSSVGLRFEQPIGNRAGRADARRSRLERMQSVVRYRLAVQDVMLDVKNTLRDVSTNYRLVAQTRISRLAATENLRSLEAEEATIRSLTPEFLNLKLTRQQALAQAELAEVQAQVNFSISLASLRRATGTSLETLELDRPAPVGPDASRGLLEDPRFGEDQ